MANEETSLLAQEPLLTSQSNNPNKKILIVKWTLKIVMWVVFIGWIGLFVLLPIHSVNTAVKSWYEGLLAQPMFALTGGAALIFTAPILLIACLAIPYTIIREDDQIRMSEKPLRKQPRLRLWTFPVLTDGPFGVVSAAEFIGISLVAVYVVWALCFYTSRNLTSALLLPSTERWSMMLKFTGISLASMGLYCSALLFLPVARGSILLRLIDIPFEHAIRYHIWLGHLTVLLFTLHGLSYIIAWSFEGTLLQELGIMALEVPELRKWVIEWQDLEVGNLPGVINFFVMLLMWITSLYPVRRKQFELFFYTHQLYAMFVILLALHVGGVTFTAVAGSIFLFMLDRFLRFLQSRKTIDVVSTKCFPCGIVELVLAKHGDLQYNALSFIFLKIKEVSWLQWHPFSVSSSPLEGKNHLSVLVKDSGNWTKELNKNLSHNSGDGDPNVLSSQAHSKITASVEGPYGHVHPYHLMYEHLILIAGGIGISPFFAILNDILLRIKDGKFCPPRNVLLIWAIKKSDELSLLSTLDMESMCPSFDDKLNLEFRIYVTRELEHPLEEDKLHHAVNYSIFPVSSANGISDMVGTGISDMVGSRNLVWSAAYLVVPIFGFAIVMTLVGVFYIKPFHIGAWWYKGLILIVIMVASVVVIGGIIILLRHLWGKSMLRSKECEESKKNIGKVQYSKAVTQTTLVHKINEAKISYGSRPDFKEIFGLVSECWGHVDVGVIVCGPPTLESGVAKECRNNISKSLLVHVEDSSLSICAYDLHSTMRRNTLLS